MEKELFQSRHIGSKSEEVTEMLTSIGVNSLDQLIDETIPASIRFRGSLEIPKPMSEFEFLNHIKFLGEKNKPFRSFIGMGFYETIIPTVILRNVIENPGWYTQYTPYQAEVAQGRLESLLNFQTMICDLTKMEVANASLLDEGTAAAEAMSMLYHISEKNKPNAHKFFVSEKTFAYTIDILKTRATPIGIEIIVGNINNINLDDSIFGALLQTPDDNGCAIDLTEKIKELHSKNILICVATDLLSNALITPPGEMGADVVVGNSQRFGVPMGYGGPHAAFFATKNEFIRLMPGRIIGVSVDTQGNKAFRMTLQTREQHIRREKATSNICTAQALLANVAAMFAVYHGSKGIKRIAENIHRTTTLLSNKLKLLGFEQLNSQYFDSIKIKGADSIKIKILAENELINFRYFTDGTIGISLDEAVTVNEINTILSIFSESIGTKQIIIQDEDISKTGISILGSLLRKSEYLTHPVFNSYHSEHEMLRYLKFLENRDLSLTHSMMPLGSCTMKLNATSEMIPISLKEFSSVHPFAPIDQTEGYQFIFNELEKYLSNISGFAACSLQPNSGAQGEYAGLLVIKAYHESKNQSNRNIVLIPSSAHGTNPASAVMAGYKVIIINCDENGNIDFNDLRKKVEEHNSKIAALMVTYPSTHGVFEEEIREICALIHSHGGQVYMDGANMNAQVGLTQPALIGADVNHINLHKTFAIPHGGGGPGMGPICVAEHLKQFLPGHSVIKTGGKKNISAISSTPWGSASILLISYGYIRMLGSEGITNATKIAILNANYLKSKLEKHFKVLYQGKLNKCAHEFILDMREFKNSAAIEVEDIAKRLIDYGFHAPTVSFPVVGTLMIEPTESESKTELDRFANALISIKDEIDDIINGKADIKDNVVKNSPHTANEALSEMWNHSYTRFKAVYPLMYLRQNKFWPSIARVNNSFGDRNLICSCPPTESYIEQ
ncbi:MAG: aminomethyl-transferring glycine dehydrogenase [Bacteroidetes bacterium]|nr:aminomethyl-transferring glycine dehydrogenase [Bacteroidota bacterium]